MKTGNVHAGSRGDLSCRGRGLATYWTEQVQKASDYMQKEGVLAESTLLAKTSGI